MSTRAGKMDDETRSRNRGIVQWIIIAVVAALIVWWIVAWNSTESAKRFWKSWESNWEGGIERTVTAYSYTGEELGSWSGRFDLEEHEDRVVFDDEDGNRVIIRGGIVIAEETGAGKQTENGESSGLPQ